MEHRLDAARIAAIADDCAELDAAATIERAARWGAACRRALDAGDALPSTLAAAAALAASEDADGSSKTRGRASAA